MNRNDRAPRPSSGGYTQTGITRGYTQHTATLLEGRPLEPGAHGGHHVSYHLGLLDLGRAAPERRDVGLAIACRSAGGSARAGVLRLRIPLPLPLRGGGRRGGGLRNYSRAR